MAMAEMAMALKGLLTVVFVAYIAPGAFAQKECEQDHECGQDSFCYVPTNVCALCISCGYYNRLVGSLRCAKDAQDCGDCKEGFRLEYRNDRTSICVPSGISLTPPPIPKDVGTFGWNPMYYITMSAICLALVVSVGGGIYYNRKRRQPARVPDPDLEGNNCLARLVTPAPQPNIVCESSDGLEHEWPPPYSRDYEPAAAGSPSAPPSPESETESVGCASITIRVSEPQKQNLQQATPFEVPPDTVFSPPEEEPLAQRDESYTQDENSLFSPLNVDDNSTLPSDWVPNRNDGGTQLSDTFDDSGVSNISSNPGSSSTSLDLPAGQPTVLSFRGLFSSAGARETRSHSPDRSEQPAKRQRVGADSAAGSSHHSVDNSVHPSSHEDSDGGPGHVPAPTQANCISVHIYQNNIVHNTNFNQRNLQ